jgi:hypothetical protein
MMTVTCTESRTVAVQCTEQRTHIISGVGYIALEWIATTTVAAPAALA